MCIYLLLIKLYIYGYFEGIILVHYNITGKKSVSILYVIIQYNKLFITVYIKYDYITIIYNFKNS